MLRAARLPLHPLPLSEFSFVNSHRIAEERARGAPDRRSRAVFARVPAA